MLPTVDFCGIETTRLIIGANPFGGFSHQNPRRDEEMKTFHSVERILETWQRAHAAGINTFITNNETPHVFQAVKEYLGAGGPMQWIAQVSFRTKSSMFDAIDEAIEVGARALYIHGALVDGLYEQGDAETLTQWLEHARKGGVPAGVAAHAPQAHRWVDELGVADLHAVCFFNCGSVHRNQGDKFQLADLARSTPLFQEIRKPCIGYKIMGAGRIDPAMAFEYAFENVKPTDVVNVGMHRGDKDDMVEENVRLVEGLLGAMQPAGV